MAASVHKRVSARRDLVEHYVYLAENAGIETAERFLTNAGESFADPKLGRQWSWTRQSSHVCANGESAGSRRF
jgi:hypothetical protein